MTGVLFALALMFLFSLAWHDQPARDAADPDHTGANKREEDPQPNHPMK